MVGLVSQSWSTRTTLPSSDPQHWTQHEIATEGEESVTQMVQSTTPLRRRTTRVKSNGTVELENEKKVDEAYENKAGSAGRSDEQVGSFVEPNITFIFGGVAVKGCEAGMQCSHVCRLSSGDKDSVPLKLALKPREKRYAPSGSTSKATFICKCDSLCVGFGDCCIDTLVQCFGLLDQDDTSIESSLKNYNEKGNPLKFSTAPLKEAVVSHKDIKMVFISYLVTFGSCVRVNNFYGVRVISSCPQDFPDQNLVDACQNGRSPLLPVISVEVKPNKYFTFKNAFCGLCHGMQKSKMLAWETSIHCKPNDDDHVRQSRNTTGDFEHLSNLVQSRQCEVHFESDLPTDLDRTCQPGYDTTPELKTSMDLAVAHNVCTPVQALLCLSYIVPYEGSRNPHCDFCTPSKGSSTLRVRRDAPSGCSTSDEWQTSNLRPGGVLVLLDITGRYSFSQSRGRTSYVCKDNEVFDPLVQTCDELSCVDGAEPYRGVCVMADGVYVPSSSQLFPKEWNTYFVSISYSQSTKRKKIDCANLLDMLMSSSESPETLMTVKKVTLNSYVYSIHRNIPDDDREFYEDDVHCVEQFFLTKGQETFQEVNFALASEKDNIEQELEEIHTIVAETIKSFEMENASIVITNIEFNSNSSICPEDQVKTQLDNFTLHTHKGIHYAAFNVTGVQFNFPLRSVGFELITQLSRDHALSLWICLNTDIFAWENCSVTSYLRNETKYIKDGDKLVIDRSKREYDRHLVYDIGDQILICDDLSNIEALGPSFGLQNDDVYLKLSWVCSSISIFFLAIMLILYWVFPELRTLPGRLIACMATTMILTFSLNLLTLYDLNHDILCPVAAVIAHFVTLSHYGWMSAIAVNMALTFRIGSVRNQGAEEETRLFRRYNIVVWGLSALIVSVSLGLDLTHNDSEHQSPQSFSEGNLTNSHRISSPPPSQTTISSNIKEFLDQQETVTRETPPFSTGFSEDKTRGNIDWVNASSKNISPTISAVPKPDQFPRYGYPYCSWFSGPLWTRLAFVLVPYGITLFIDVVGFAITMRGIISASKSSAKTLAKPVQYRTQCVIFLKLSTTMGISWTISVFFTVSYSQVLEYLYTALVLLQGFLLFLAFMVNKRVLGLVRKRFPCTSRLLYKIKSSTLGANSSQETQRSDARSTCM